MTPTKRSSEDSLGEIPTTRARRERLAHVGGAQALVARFGETENGEPFWNVLPGLGGGSHRRLFVSGPWSERRQGVLLEAELAVLPGAGAEGGAQGGTEADVGV